MTRIASAIVIQAPIEKIFDYVTTPANWPNWHPASLAVGEGADHPLEVGERVTEDFEAAGRRGRAVWTVRERAPPHRWVIDGTSEGGGEATITYRLTPEGGAARFERELVYHMPNLTLAFLNIVVIRRRMAAESAEALRRLKAVLEAG
ncbi:MAG: SRPBCC family protein [Geminicoccaceae bacterium]